MIDLSPDQFRVLGYQAVDLLTAYLSQVAALPTRQPVPAAQREAWLTQPIPQQPSDPAALLERFAEEVLPYPMGNNSPRFFAWVNSPPAPFGALADMLASLLNSSVAGGDHAATYIEHAVLNWMKTIFGYPATTGGVLVSGGSAANLVCLAAMRNHVMQGQVRAYGFYDQSAPLVVYTSTEGHSCIQKALEVLGFGSQHLHKVPVDANFRLDTQALKAQIAADRAAGLLPVCVAASAGTVNTGAIDPLDVLADLCAAEGLWLHVDASYGGMGILAPETQGLYKGLHRADSLALDQHKWLYIPIECGCALVKDAQIMRDTFSLVPPYLRDDRQLPWFSEFSFQQTRGFRALKLWLVLQQVGLEGYRTLISHDIQLARALRAKIQAHPQFELVAGGPLSVTCFRYRTAAADADALQQALAEQVNASGQAFLHTTQLQGRTVLRACIVNFRTTETDLDILLSSLVEAAHTLPTDSAT